jgi:hypothetical protein
VHACSAARLCWVPLLMRQGACPGCSWGTWLQTDKVALASMQCYAGLRHTLIGQAREDRCMHAKLRGRAGSLFW